MARGAQMYSESLLVTQYIRPCSTMRSALDCPQKRQSILKKLLLCPTGLQVSVDKFVRKHLMAGQKVHSDALSALSTYSHKRFKNIFVGTFHGVTGKYLQEYLDEFCYRFNRRFIEKNYLQVVKFGNKSCPCQMDLSQI